jgi:hypothetical protein
MLQKHVRKIFGVALVLAVMVGVRPDLLQATQGASNSSRNDPLLWAPLIIRGEIEGIDKESSSFSEWGIVAGEDHSVVVDNLAVRVDEVIKGTWKDTHIAIAAFQYHRGTNPTPYAVGNDVILAVFYNTATARFQLRNYTGLFIQDGDDWTRPDPKMYRIYVENRSATLREITRRVSSMSPLAVVGQAELVVAESVGSVERGVLGADGSESTCWSFEIAEVLKGDYCDSTVTFCMPTRRHLPDWAAPVPRYFGEGDTFVVFLRHRDDSWIPFAGVNGMLELLGDRLLYEGVVDIGTSWTQLRAACGKS